jgi:hypothetical protein
LTLVTLTVMVDAESGTALGGCWRIGGRRGLGALRPELEAVMAGGVACPSTVRRLAPTVGWRTADLFVVAGLDVPQDLVPATGTRPWHVGSVLEGVVMLAPQSVSRLREAVRTLPEGSYHDGVRIEFTYSRSSDYFRPQLRVAAWRAVRSMLLLAAVLAVGGAVAVAINGGSRAGALGIVAIVVAILLALWARHRFVDAITVPASWRGRRAWTITEEALESNTDLTSFRWTWPTVHGVEQRPEAYLF